MFDTLEGGECPAYSLLADTAKACREGCRHRIVEIVRPRQREFVKRNLGGVGRKGGIENIDYEIAVLDVSTRDEGTVAHLFQAQSGERDELCLEGLDTTAEGIDQRTVGVA